MSTPQRNTAIIFAGLVLAISLGLVSCGLTSTGTGGADTGAPAAATSNSNCGGAVPSTRPPSTPGTVGLTPAQGSVVPIFTPGATLNPHPPSATPPLGLPTASGATITPGHVTVTTDRSSYSACDDIQVTVANGLSSTIYVASHQTSCTIVTLEEQVNGNWQPIDLCTLMIPTRLYAIKSGTAVGQTLRPGAGGIRPRGSGSGGISPQGAGGQGMGGGQPVVPSSTTVPSPYQGWPTGTYRILLTYGSGARPAAGVSRPVYSATFTIA